MGVQADSIWRGQAAAASPHGGVAYRADVDGLRAVAVLGVVIGHFWPEALPGGFVGVDVFFVISGFLITQILLREWTEGRFTLARFYGRRARRLFPALFVVLAATCLVGSLVLLPSDLAGLFKALLATLFFGANLLFWRQSTNYFDATETLDNPLLHLWSLGVEEQFYLFFPWALLALLAWAVRRGRDPVAVLRLGLLLAAALNLLLAGVVNGRNTNAAFFLSPLRAWEFMAGAWVAMHPSWHARKRWMREALAGTALLVLLACMGLYSPYTSFPGWAAVPPVLAAAVLLQGGAAGTVVSRCLSQPAPVGVGLISYSLYLWHWPVLVLARHGQAMVPSPWWEPAWLALALLLSVWTWRYVEQPWRRPPHARPRFGAAWALAALTGLVAVASLGLFRNGYEARVPAQALAFDRVRHAARPLKECEDRPATRACVLGDRSAAPDVMLWGDSHMLAWAPALDRLMLDARRSAVLNVHLACAPFIELHNTRKKTCGQASQDVWAYLQAHPSIRTVVLAGYWGHYFRSHSPSRATGERGETLEGLPAARRGLDATLARLLASGREVVLIGPVPTYAFNVPQVLALHDWRHRAMPAITAEQQAQRQGGFWASVQPWRQASGLRLLDPIDWFCAPACLLQAEGQSLYRDEQHLSAWGARWAEPQLARALGIERPPSQP